MCPSSSRDVNHIEISPNSVWDPRQVLDLGKTKYFLCWVSKGCLANQMIDRGRDRAFKVLAVGTIGLSGLLRVDYLAFQSQAQAFPRANMERLDLILPANLLSRDIYDQRWVLIIFVFTVSVSVLKTKKPRYIAAPIACIDCGTTLALAREPV